MGQMFGGFLHLQTKWYIQVKILPLIKNKKNLQSKYKVRCVRSRP